MFIFLGGLPGPSNTRDDKKERAVARGGMSLKERAVAKGSTPTQPPALSLGNGPLFTTALSFLSSPVVTFLIFRCFCTPNQMFFNLVHKAVILSEAPRRSIAYRRVLCAESKDRG